MQHFDTPGHVAFHISVGAGTVDVVTGAEGETEVEVVPLRDDESTRRAAAETRVQLTERGDGHELRIESPERLSGLIIRRGPGPKLGVTVRCPGGSDLDVKTLSATVRADGVLGAVTAKTMSGDVTIGDARSVDVRTVSGALSAQAVDERCSLKTTSGDAHLARVGGSLDISAVSGDVDAVETLGSINASMVSGDVHVGAFAAGPVRISTVSGDVRLGARSGLRLYLDVSSVSGSARCDLDVDEVTSADGDAVELRVRSVSGDVRIERAAGVHAS